MHVKIIEIGSSEVWGLASLEKSAAYGSGTRREKPEKDFNKVSLISSPVAKVSLSVWPAHPGLEVPEPQSIRL